MDGLCEKLIANYEINASNVRKTKGYYVMSDANANTYSLRKTSDSDERIALRLLLQEHLVNNGFVDIEKIYKTKTGELFASLGEQKYILCDNIVGRESDFNEPGELTKILTKLALFHYKTEGLSEVCEQFYAKDLTQSLSKMRTELAMLRKKVVASKSLSNFDILFLKNYEHYEKNIHMSSELLKSAKYSEKLKDAFSKNSFCHNMLKKESLVIKDGEVFIAMLSGAYVDHFSADIALVINKYMKYVTQRQVGIVELIDKYCDCAKTEVDGDDLKIILARLLMPGAFLEAAREYYSKKRSWAPSALISEIEHEINSKAQAFEYIEPLMRICGLD